MLEIEPEEVSGRSAVGIIVSYHEPGVMRFLQYMPYAYLLFPTQGLLPSVAND
jgi:hypothetical protein